MPTLFEGDYATAEGISYLDAKHLLMLSYCINIVFYLLLKSEGKPVRDHPVVLRLVEGPLEELVLVLVLGLELALVEELACDDQS